MLDRRGVRAAEARAERVGWRDRSRSSNRASRSLDARLRRMNRRAAALDLRLWHHAQNSSAWHWKWDDPIKARDMDRRKP